MGCVGQVFTCVAWVTRVKTFFAWIIIFMWFAWVKNSCGGLNFCVSDFLGVAERGVRGHFLKISGLEFSFLVLREF